MQKSYWVFGSLIGAALFILVSGQYLFPSQQDTQNATSYAQSQAVILGLEDYTTKNKTAVLKRENTVQYTTRTKKTIYVTETHPVGASLSDITVTTEGFHADMAYILRNQDPLVDVVLADLNEDSFDEIYFFTQSAGSGSYGGIIAYAPHYDANFDDIFLMPVTVTGQEKMHKDYSGHDIFVVEPHRIARSTSLYTSERPFILYYELTKDGLQYLLAPVQNGA